MDSAGVIQCLVLLILVFLSAFFSSAETALSTVNRVRIQLLAEEKNPRALIIQKILGQYGKMLSAILIGNNIVNLSASSLATTLAIRIWGSAWVGVATGVLTIVILLVGEIVPKNWAVANSETISLKYARIIYALMLILTPVIFLVDCVSSWLMRLLGVDQNKKEAITEGELLTYVREGLEDGVLENDEHEIITSVFDFSDSQAHDIMIPRAEMVTVDIEDSYDQVFQVFRENMYTRLPVYQDDRNNIVGLINIKDFFLVQDKESFQVQQILRDVYFAYESQDSGELLKKMKEATDSNLAIVIDEYGMTVGMITMEDLLEELVGDIRDEYDEDEETEIQQIRENQYLIDGSIRLTDLNDQLELDLESQDYESLGGLIIESLSRLPKEGETVTLPNGIVLTVTKLQKRHIEQVRLQLPDQAAPDQTEEA